MPNVRARQEQMQRGSCPSRNVADKDTENDKRLRDYTTLNMKKNPQADGKGQVKSTEAKTYEVMELSASSVQG